MTIQKHYFISDSTIIIYVDIHFLNSTVFLHDYCSALTEHNLKSALFFLLFAFSLAFYSNSILFNAFNGDNQMGPHIYLFCSFYSATGHSNGHPGPRVRCVILAPVVPAQEGIAALLSTQQSLCWRTDFSQSCPVPLVFPLLFSHSVSKTHTYFMTQICK